MRNREQYDCMAGKIRLFEREPNGVETLITGRSNVIAYTAADLLAKLVAGSVDAAPAHIGFIYGGSPNPGASMSNPGGTSVSPSRVQDWGTISGDVEAAGANMIICPLVLPPAVSRDSNSDADMYTANKTTFTAHTGAFNEYAYPTDGAVYAGTVDSLGTVYFYHAVLLNRKVVGASTIYTPFARVAVGTAPFTAKAVNRELAIYWDIVFR